MAGLREALEEAYDVQDSGEAIADAPTEPLEPVEAAPEAEAEEVSAAGPERDEQGRFTKQEPAQDTPAPTPVSPAAGQGAVAAPPPVAAPVFKPPQSWKPAVREKWATLPPEVQAEVVRREKEVAQALQQSAEKGKAVDGWSETVRPYEAQIRSAGGDPHKYVGDLLQTAHALNYAPPHQKADMLANIIMQFGVPPADLDRALVARMNGQVQAQPQQQQPLRDTRFDEFLAQQQAAAQEEASDSANSFAESHEFFDDVAEHLADILDVWAKQGKKKISEDDMERAYQIACNSNDDVAQILNQRKQASSIGTAQAATQRARAAASSVRTQPTAAPAAQPSGRRAAIEAAYDAME